MAQIILSDDIKSISYNASALSTVKYNDTIVWDINLVNTGCIVFSSTEDATVRVTKGDSAVEYSMNGETWSDVDGVMMCSLNPSKLYLRNKSENVPTISIDGTAVYITGNITTMIDYTKPYKSVDIPDESFMEWLKEYDIRSAPSIICRRAGKKAFYNFAYKSGITVAPEVNVGTTEESALSNAFSLCSKLNTPVSVKLGTTEGFYSMSGMFSGSNITEATVTFGDIENHHYAFLYMFMSCSKLEKLRLYGNFSEARYNTYRMIMSCPLLSEIYCTSDYVGFHVTLSDEAATTGTLHVKTGATVGVNEAGWTIVRDL